MSSLNRLPSLFSTRKLGSQTPVPTTASTSTYGSSSEGSGMPKALRDLSDQVNRGLLTSLDSSTLSAVLDLIRHTESIDDRKLLLEHALTFLSRLPDGSIATAFQNKVVELLYNDLAHPPATFIGTQYAWRTADGSYNNLSSPDMGKAGTPYARSVQQSHPLPQSALPDSGLVFDTLLKRDGFVKHPAGLSSMMFSFAALVIHSVFRTSHRDVNINETSSYVDLAPLYGHNQEAQNKVRVRDGRGLLYPDVFAEDRLLLLPPAVCVLLVLFSRNHNYIAKKLLEINERGTYVDPATLSPDDPEKNKKLIAQEEEIFQTARLINAAWFASVVFSDYFSCILGLVRSGSSWSLNPFGEIRNADHSLFERGRGNVCSVEFNCLYRWHATTSVADEQWITTVFSQIFEGKNIEDVTPDDFKHAARKIQAMEPDIQHWTFGSLQRQGDGTFKDEDLARYLQEATEHPAAAFRARGTPAVMRLHEIMGIEQNRRWGVCSLNDFRKYLGLKPYASFREWNPNPEVADAAEKLYGDIDHLELYVGLQAEEAKPVVDGAGLCPGYTISRAILSDAIALTRGDRFFTADYTPFNMTAWGFADCQKDPNGAGFGSTLGRLILRTLPEQFTANSVYTWFPLMTPDAMKTNLTKLKVIDKYDISRPSPRGPIQIIKDYAEATEILTKSSEFLPPYASRAATVIKGDGFFTASADAVRGEREQREVLSIFSSSPETLDQIGRFIHDTTRKLIISNSYSLIGVKTRAVDLVRDVLAYVPLYWVATEIAGIPLKTKETPHGEYTPRELYTILCDIYSFIFLEPEPAKYMVLQEKVKGDIGKLLLHIKSNLAGDQRLSVIGFVGTFSRFFSKAKQNEQHVFVKRLFELGHSSDQLANSILALLVGTPELSIALTNMINLYLGSDKDAELRASITSTGSKVNFDGYIYESLRLDPSFRGVYRIPPAAQGPPISRIFLDIATANLDEHAFPNPSTVDLTRAPKERYLLGDGATKSFGTVLTGQIMSQVLRAVFEFTNVRRAPGQSGTLKRFKDESNPIFQFAYLDASQTISPWPTSLSIQFDEAPSS